MKVLEARPSDALRQSLLAARHAGRVVRSLEKAEALLTAEARGQQMADRRSGTARGERISRLLILAQDGADRFYRRVESLLERHHPRVMAVLLTANADEVGAMVFGSRSAARLILIEHKTAVATVLSALSDQWIRDEPPEPLRYPIKS